MVKLFYITVGILSVVMAFSLVLLGGMLLHSGNDTVGDWILLVSGIVICLVMLNRARGEIFGD